MGTWQAGKEMWVGIDDDQTTSAIRAAFEAGITTFESDAVDELERCFPVAGRNPSALVELVNALCHQNLIAACCSSEGILQVFIGIGPA